ncbi:hypothetical protein [Dysosmobacter welbionis]
MDIEKLIERLTYFDSGKWRMRIGDTEYSGKAVDRLAAYEETGLEPEEVRRCLEFEDICLDEYIKYERLHELAQADREGRCVVLPCKVGDKLYEAIRHRNSGEMEVVERIVQSIEFFADSYYVKMYRWKPCKETNGVLSQRVDSWAKETDIGKTVFLIRKEAEAALRREQDG